MLAQLYGWHAGFALGGVLMLLGLATYIAGYRTLAETTPAANRAQPEAKLDANAWRAVAGGEDVSIASGVVEQNQGAGIDLTGAIYASVTGMFIDNNGKGANGGAGIQLANAHTVSICGNHISGNDIGGSQTRSAQIRFRAIVDGANLCGNVYAAEDQPGNATFAPAFV